MLCNEQGIKLSFSKKIQMAKDACLGINWLHEANPPIIHGNITPNNLLVDENLQIKVSDFGMNKIKQIFGPKDLFSDSQKNLENLKWLAPEILEGNPVSEKADVYSFGLILWMLLTLQKPYLEIFNFEKLKENVISLKLKPTIPPSCPNMLRELISSCCAENPATRPNLKSVIPILDALIIETAIPDTKAAAFWKNNFSDQTQVEWPIFINALATEIKLIKNNTNKHINKINLEITLLDKPQLQQIKCLHALLATKQVTGYEREVVSLGTFGWVVSWFGSLQTNFLNMIHSIVFSSWFHGDISAQVSVGLLQSCTPGTFLIRLSLSNFGGYTLSYVSPARQINHYRFYYDLQKNVFVISETEYPTIATLLEEKRKIFGLTVPCLGSKYCALHTEMESRGYIGSNV